MANKELKATAKLFLDTSSAKQDAAQFVGDLKKKLRDVETAADKMSVFKDLVGYIGQVDAALTALRAKNQDAFDHMFDGLDDSLRKALESIFGMSGEQIGQFKMLREQMDSFTTKSSIKDVREFAKSINALYESVGKTPPLKIDEFSRSVKPKNIEDIRKAVDDLSLSLGEVNNRLKSGFGFGGGSGSGGTVVSEISEEVQAEIDRLEDCLNQFENLKKDLKKKSKASIDFELSTESVKNFLKEYEKLSDSVENYDGDVFSDDYQEQVQKYVKMSSQLLKLQDEFKKVSKNASISQRFPEYDDLSLVAEDVLASVNEGSLIEAEDSIKNVQNLIADLKRIGSLNVTPDTESISNAVNELQRLNNVLNEGPDNFSYDVITFSIDTLNNKILELAKNSEHFDDVQNMLEGFEGFDTDSEFKTFLTDLCDLLGVKLSSASNDAQKSIENIIPEGSNKNITILAKQLQEIFDTSRQIGDHELGFAIDSSGMAYFIESADGIVKAADEAAVAVASLNDNMTFFGHTHPDGGGLFSVDDIYSAISQKRAGVNSPTMLVGKAAASILNLDGASDFVLNEIETYLKQFERDSTVSQRMTNEMQGIFEKGGLSNALQVVETSTGMDALADAIQNITSNATEAQTPLQKLQSLISYYSGNKLGSNNIAEFSTEWKDFESGAKSAAEVFDGVMAKLGATDIEGNAFNTSEKLYNNLSASLNMLSSDAQKAGMSVDNAKEKLESFLTLSQDLQVRMTFEDVEIGQLLTQLDYAKNELQELAKQGAITEQQLEEVFKSHQNATDWLEHRLARNERDREDELDNYKQDAHNAQMWADTYFGDAAVAEDRADKAEARVAELESRLQETQARAAEAERRAEEYRDDVSAYDAAAQRIFEEKWDLERENDKLKNQLKEANAPLNEQLELVKQISQAYDDLADAQSVGTESQEEKAKEKVEALEEQYYGLIATMKDGSKIQIPLDDEFSEMSEKMLQNAAQIQNIEFVPRDAENAINAYERIDKVLANINKRWKDPETLERAVGSFSHRDIEDTQRYLKQATEAIESGDADFKFGLQDKYNQAIKALEKLDALSERVDLSQAFGGFTDGLDVEWTEELGEAYLTVLSGIKDGTHTTLDDCIAKFKELTRTIEESTKTDPVDATEQSEVLAQASEEIAQLDALKAKLNEVTAAVEAKTAAFEAGYVTADAAIEAEIDSLNKLKSSLEEVQNLLQFVLPTGKSLFGEIEAPQDKASANSAQNIIASIQATLGQILGVLQGFTGIDSDGKNSVKKKEPVVDNRTMASEAYELLAQKLPDNIATEGTLQGVKGAIENLASVVKAQSDSDSSQIDGTHQALNTLIGALSANIKSLKDVMDGVIPHQKAQKSDTTKAMARIQDSTQFKQISSIAENSIGSLGTDVHIKSLKALANGLVGVEGAFKNVNGEWEGFTVKVNESNAAVDLAVNKQSAFAKVMRKLEEEMAKVSADDNKQKLSPDHTANSAIVKANMYDEEGKEVTVQYKDSQRYTVSLKENIGGLQKEVFQTFDDSIEDFNERTTVTVSNKTAQTIRETNKLIEDNAQKVNNADLLSMYNQEYKKLLDMNDQYRNKSISDNDINSWNQQITLVQNLGNEVANLIKHRQRLESKAGSAASGKRIQDYQATANKTFKGLDFGINDSEKTPEQQAIVNTYDQIIEKLDLLHKTNAVLTDSQIQEINQLIDSLNAQADAYLKAKKQANEISAEDQLKLDVDVQRDAIAQYQESIKDVDYITEGLSQKLVDLQSRLNNINSPAELDEIQQDFASIKKEVDSAKDTFEKINFGYIGAEESKLKGSFNKLIDEQKIEVQGDYEKAMATLEEYRRNVQSGQKVELDAINEVVSALRTKINAYNELNKKASRKTTGQAYGTSQLQTFTARYNSLMSGASDVGLNEQSTVVANLTNAYKQLQAAQSAFVAGEDKTTAEYAKKVEVFKAAQLACNSYARDLNKVVTASKKLAADSIISDSLAEDFEDSFDGRKTALMDFVNTMYGANVSVGEFDDAFNKLNFSVKNSDGTFTKMTASINEARTAIHATAGATGEVTGRFEAFFGELKGKFKSIGSYFAASMGWEEILQQVRQGFQYVRDIDAALTELKKVTNETDATYNNFLQSMSKTAGVVGSTVADLTNMAADWSRLGYTLEDSAKLAESTAVLLNVSEFQDATAASEALISTMQAFGYVADDSQHVVDILNEVGNNYAVSSDGIATALQDSASALMEAGNNLEQSVALVAAANKVVQDPNSVGSALRTISLRLRGTSVEILESMGEETDGAAESISKMQEKLKALTGVDILTDSGAYKDTYTILKEIAAVWDDMSNMDQAAALELMAGKNRANTLAAILNNMEDLKGAYESALNAEGSALKENEAYLDSIQGRIDLLNNSVQTMWMNFMDSEAVKFLTDILSGVIQLIDGFGVLETALVGVLSYFNLSKNSSFDIASMLGIHKQSDKFMDGFSIFGKEGLTGWISKQFSKLGEVEVESDVGDKWLEGILGDPEAKKAYIQNLANSIKDNINDYVELDTSVIDKQIKDIQNKLDGARQGLAEAKNADWDYYKSRGYQSPAKERDVRIAEKTKEVNALEAQLQSLQNTRNEMISSAAMDVATSQVNQIEAERNAYQSMLSVLSEVSDKKLSIGNEKDAAKKIDLMSKAAQNGQEALAGYVTSLDSTDTALKAYAASVTDGNYSLAGFQQFVASHNAGLKQTGIAAKAAAVGHQMLNAALSMGITMIASFAISTLINAFDDWIHKAEKAKDAALEAGNAIKTLSDDFKSTEKFVTANIDRFAELAQGVDMLSGANLSLTTDDYEEFLNLSNQLADVFPTLSRNYDENGNAIVQLSGDTNTMVSSLERLLEAQRQLTNQKIAENLPDLYAGTKAQSDEYETQIKSNEMQIERYRNMLKSLDSDDLTRHINSLFTAGNLELDGTAQSEQIISNIKNVLDSIGIKSTYTKDLYGASNKLEIFNWQSILPNIQDTKAKIGEGIDTVKAEYNTKIGELEADIVQINKENKANWNSISSGLFAWMSTDSTYQTLDDNMKSMMQTVVNNLDYASLDLSTWEDASEWIKDNIFELFTDSSLKNDAAKQLSEMFNLQSEFQSGKIDLGGYKDQINEFIDFVKNSGIAEETQKQLLKMFDIDYTKVLGENPQETFGTNIDAMVSHAKSLVDTSRETVENELKALSEGGTVDLLVRPTLSASTLRGHGWSAEDGDIATILSNTFSNEEGTIAMNFTPIMVDENGKYTGMLSPDKLQEYAEGVIAGTREDDLNLKIGTTFEGEDAIKNAEKIARSIHELHDNYFLGNSEIPFDQLSYSDLQVINSDQFNVEGYVIASWEQLQYEIEQTRIAMTPDFTTDNFADYADNISTISGSIATYKEALESLESGSFTITDFMELIAQFPELAEGVDLTSGEFKGLASNLGKAIRNSPDDLVKELENLRDGLEAAGKSTDAIDQLIDSVQNMPTDAVKGMSAEYATLAEQISAAEIAKNNLDKAMSENPNENFETRSSALEKMKDLMSKGMIGSESELWSIAEAYGFTYESANSINDNANALYEFIKAREKLYATDKDGNHTLEGTENIAKIIEKATKSKEFKEAMEAQGLDLSDFQWSFKNGVLDFDFDNQNWDAIVAALGETAELTGLTSEEFKDLLVQIGQFFDVNWEDAADLEDYIVKIGEGSGTAKEKIDSMTSAVEKYVEKALGEDVDLSNLTEDAIDEIAGSNEEIKQLLKTYLRLKNEMSDPLKVESIIEGADNLDGLLEIKELQGAIQKFGNGITVIDTDAFSSVLTEAGYTEEQISNLIAKIQEYKRVCEVSTTDPLGLSNTDASLASVSSSLDFLGVEYETLKNEFDDPIGININAVDLITTLQAQGWTQEKISAYIQTLTSTENGMGIQVDGQVNMNAEQVDAAIKKVDNMPKSKDVKVNATGNAVTRVAQINTQLSRLTSKIHEIKVNVTKTGDDLANGTVQVSGTVHANGTAHAQGTAYKSGSWGAQHDETALVGELGPELLVRGSRWTTIGANGAEFRSIKKGDIIFNHKQTADLLSKGYITGRGKAYANGTAYASGNSTAQKFNFGSTAGSSASSLSKAADKLAKAGDKFKEVFDWIEVRIEEITEALDLKGAKLDNAVGSSKQNNIVADMIEINKELYKNLIAGSKEYNKFASELLKKVPEQYREKAKNGAIDIDTFVDKNDEKAIEAINEYREWVQKGAEVTQQAEETLTEIADLAKQAFDNIVTEFENKVSIGEGKIDQLDAYNALTETLLGAESEKIYQAMIKASNQNIALLQEQRNAMQAELNEQVNAGNIKKYSDAWYEAVNAISEVDTEIIELTTDTNEYQDAINELHWDNFDNLIDRFKAISSEADNLIDILGTEDLVDKDTAEWTDEGLTSLGLYAQKMESAEMQAKKYEEEIKYLNKNWKKLGYTEQEYIEKLEDLKDGQYDAIKAYNDTKDAIVDLNSTRIEAIKEGIEKEIEAYEELINKKKEELDAEKDLYDFQKGVANQQKEIAEIERKIAALSADNSASARAKRAQLEAELLQAKADLEDTYYDRSVENQQNALDKELESFQKEKDDEIKSWDEYLENAEQVVSDSLTIIQNNTGIIYQTLDGMGQEYSLSITEALTSPWQDGEDAIQSYSEKFGLSMSSTVEELNKVANEYKKVMSEIESYGDKVVGQANANATKYQAANKQQMTPDEIAQNTKDEVVTKTIAVNGKVDAYGALIYKSKGAKKGSSQKFASDPIYTVLEIDGDWIKVRHHSKTSGTTGWFKKSDVEAYAKGSLGVPKDQWALIDELGEELQLIPDGNGRLSYMKKGTGIVPADLTANLMEWGKLDPSTMLDNSKPKIGVSPSVVNNTTEIHIDASVGELLHVEHLDGNNPAEITKIVDKAWDKRMKELNGFVRKYSR